jgi:acyl-CoA dehydrogenase
MPRPKGDEAAPPIIYHPDVRRMLLSMRAGIEAMRALTYLAAAAIDAFRNATGEAARSRAGRRADLLIPVVKAWCTDIGCEVASIGVQVHGGMGYIEETGAAQHMRDARIAAIYEGANGVQAIDLVQRKLPLSDGATVAREIAAIRAVVAEVAAAGGAEFGPTAQRLGEAADALDQATKYLRDALGANSQDALAGATPYLRLFGLALGGACLAKAGLAAEQLGRNGDSSQLGRVALARFFAEKIAVGAIGLESAIRSGGDALHHYEMALREST